MAIRQDASTGELVDDKSAAPAGDKAAAGNQPTMSVKIYAPFKVYYEGNATSLSAVNAIGPFDILPHHHNFLCMLEPGDIVVKSPYETKTIKIAKALMHVKADRVVVFVDV